MIDRLVVNTLSWAAGHTDEGRFSPVGIAFHWTMAAMVGFQLGWGWWMGRLPVGGDKLAAYDLHFTVGLVMLALALGRLGWRLFAPEPINDADKPGWESVAAHITHYLFYTCLLGLPLTGWAMVSATGREFDAPILGPGLPLLPFQDLDHPTLWALEAVAEWMHWGLILTLLLLIPIHIGGALKHQFIDQDDVLHGMAPIIPEPTPRRTWWRRRYRALERRLAATASRLWPRSRPRSTPRRRGP